MPRIGNRLFGTAICAGALAAALAPPPPALADTIVYQFDTPNPYETYNGLYFGACGANCYVTSEADGGADPPSPAASAFNIFSPSAPSDLLYTFSTTTVDYSGVGGTPNTLLADFISQDPVLLPGGTSLTVTGAVQDLITIDFLDQNGAVAGSLDFQFQAPLPNTSVPAPSATVLAGALLGSALARLRSRR